MSRTIDRFSGKYSFLSNFWYAEVELGGVKCPTVEHAFQASKTNIASERQYVLEATSPAIAKRRGRQVTCVANWEQVKVDVMLGLLRQKFVHAELKEQLLKTGTAQLIEGNWWKDTFWGVCNGVGQNWLGKLLMQVRHELQGNEPLFK